MSLLTSAEFELCVETNRASRHVEVLERQPILIVYAVVATAGQIQRIRNQITGLRIDDNGIRTGELARLRTADAGSDGLPVLVYRRFAAIAGEPVGHVQAV